MKNCRNNLLDGTSWEFPGKFFWLIHIIGPLLIFSAGVRFAMRRAPFSLLAYRLVRMLAHR